MYQLGDASTNDRANSENISTRTVGKSVITDVIGWVIGENEKDDEFRGCRGSCSHETFHGDRPANINTEEGYGACQIH